MLCTWLSANGCYQSQSGLPLQTLLFFNFGREVPASDVHVILQFPHAFSGRAFLLVQVGILMLPACGELKELELSMEGGRIVLGANGCRPRRLGRQIVLEATGCRPRLLACRPRPPRRLPSCANGCSPPLWAPPFGRWAPLGLPRRLPSLAPFAPAIFLLDVLLLHTLGARLRWLLLALGLQDLRGLCRAAGLVRRLLGRQWLAFARRF